MKILQINTCNYGSTGKIMLQIAQTARCSDKKHTVLSSCSKAEYRADKNDKEQLPIGSKMSRFMHIRLALITGFNECFSFFSTAKFLRKIKKYKPDIIHLHNLHGWYINLPMLFKYIKKNDIQVVWTLHDCWSFTGHCPHFIIEKCDKWKSGCYDCPKYREYPHSYVDNSRYMYKRKKKWFAGVKDLTIVTPSEWLADLVRQSYLKEYPVKVINNGTDLEIFKPTDSDFRNKYSCENKKIVLGVAFDWGVRKGLDVFVELSKRLPLDYQMVLVGTNDEIDQQIPDNIISIHRTHDQKELAEIYTAADVFINPTREENYPTVNMESLACGTPVITFRTGGSPEIIDQTCGVAVDVDDVDAMEKEIIRICEQHPYSQGECLEHAKSFDMNDRFKEYVDLYEKLK